MGLGWDADSRTIVVELLAVSEEEVDESVVLDDGEEGPDALRVFLSPVQARAFAERAEKVVSAGRPPCPLCAEPLDPDGPRLRPAQRLPPPVPRSRSDRRSRGPARPGRPRAAAARADGDHRPARRRLERDAVRHGQRGRRGAAVRLQAGPRGAAAVGLPGRHARRARGGQPSGVGGRRAGTSSRRRCCATGRSGPGWCRSGWTPTTSASSSTSAADGGAAGLAGGAAGPRRARRARGARARGRPRAARDGGVRRGGQQRRPQGRARARRRRRPDLRGRPRAVPARRAQAAHRAVGLGRAADDPGGARAAARAAGALDGGGAFRDELGEHVTRREVRALRSRVDAPAERPCFPEPAGYGPAIPWPAF